MFFLDHHNFHRVWFPNKYQGLKCENCETKIQNIFDLQENPLLLYLKKVLDKNCLILNDKYSLRFNPVRRSFLNVKDLMPSQPQVWKHH